MRCISATAFSTCVGNFISVAVANSFCLDLDILDCFLVPIFAFVIDAEIYSLSGLQTRFLVQKFPSRTEERVTQINFEASTLIIS